MEVQSFSPANLSLSPQVFGHGGRTIYPLARHDLADYKALASLVS
jgi:hypothetical protein